MQNARRRLVASSAAGLAGAALTLSPASAHPDAAPASPVGGGTTGYEDFLAADQIQRADEVIGIASGGLKRTLADKRKAFADPHFAQTVALLRRALNKGIRLPTDADGEPSFRTSANMRQMARVLSVKIAVDFADGRNSDALDAVEMAYAVSDIDFAQPTATLGSTLTAASVENMADFYVAPHIAQLSLGDCVRLEAILRRRLRSRAAVGPQTLLARDQAHHLRALERMVDTTLDATAKPDFDGKNEDGVPLPEDDTAALHRWRRDPAARAALHDEVRLAALAETGPAAAALQRPWSSTFRSAAPPTNEKEAERVARDLLITSIGNDQDVLLWECETHVLAQAYLRLTYVTAALREYRCRHGAYPATLSALTLGGDGIDPFSGAPFVYHRDSGDTFTLTSVGPPRRHPLVNVKGPDREPLSLNGKVYLLIL